MIDLQPPPVDEEGLIELARAWPRPRACRAPRAPRSGSSSRRSSSLGFDYVRVDAAGNAIGEIGQRQRSAPAHRRAHRLDPAALDRAVDGRSLRREDPRRQALRPRHLRPEGVDRRRGARCRRPRRHRRARRSGRGRRERLRGGDGGPGAGAGVVDEFAPDVVITSEPNDTRLCIGQRGRAKAWVTVVGRACHAGHAARRAERGRGARRVDRRGRRDRAPDASEARRARPHVHRHRVVAVPVGVDGARAGRGPLRLPLPSRRDAGVDRDAAARVRARAAWARLGRASRRSRSGSWTREFETWTGAQLRRAGVRGRVVDRRGRRGREGRAGRHGRRRASIPRPRTTRSARTAR